MSASVLAAGELVNGQVPLGEAVAFWILGPVALAGGIGMVLFRNAIHSALSLVATMMCLGAFYLIEQGPFLGLVQIIVYTGAIMILFLFVLMLVGRDSTDSIVESLRGQRWAAALFGVGFALLVALSVGRAFKGRKPVELNQPNANGNNVQSIAGLLFTKYLFAFELTSALLIVAAVGAMVLAHIEREGPKPGQKLQARERIRSGRPQPLPGPGVLSTGNAIGTPALLPDGTISHESVMVGDEDFPPHVSSPRRLPTADYDDSEVRQ
jgi:NADH-quinone oxidoreductase subunit J